MSSHHSQKFFNTHHGQVSVSRDRQLERQVERLQNFLAMRKQLRMEYDISLVFGFICFAYTMFATATYLGYVL